MHNTLPAPAMAPAGEDPFAEDPYIASRHIAEQAGFLELTQDRFTPAFAYEVGHDALSASVQVDVASVEAAPAVEARSRPPEARAAEVAAETWRTFTPFNAENAAMFDSEEGRQEAMRTVRGIAEQADVTNKYFNGQHKRLARQHAAGEISREDYDNAVGEIVAVMALTKPEQLRQVGEAQRAAIERRTKAGTLEGVAFVEVVSHATSEGVQLAGIDSVVARMTGARSQAELAQHGMELKMEAYSAEALAKASERQAKQQDLLEAQVRAAKLAEQEVVVRRTRELIDEAENKETTNA